MSTNSSSSVRTLDFDLAPCAPTALVRLDSEGFIATVVAVAVNFPMEKKGEDRQEFQAVFTTIAAAANQTPETPVQLKATQPQTRRNMVMRLREEPDYVGCVEAATEGGSWELWAFYESPIACGLRLPMAGRIRVPDGWGTVESGVEPLQLEALASVGSMLPGSLYELWRIAATALFNFQHPMPRSSAAYHAVGKELLIEPKRRKYAIGL